MSQIIVDKGVRFQNYFIDCITVFIVYFFVTRLFRPLEPYYLLVFQIIYFLYFFLSEFNYRQTLGKRFTKTKVVNKYGEKPTFKNILIRSVFRIAGLDAISFLFGNNVGMHDLFSNTRVVKFKKNKLTRSKTSSPKD